MELRLTSKNHAAKTAVKIGNVSVGRGFVVIAGPCSVESREQLLTIARHVKSRGADYRKGTTSRSVCVACRRPILGVAKGRKVQLSKIPGSRKKVSRTYGGVLCPTCLRERLQESAAAEWS